MIASSTTSGVQILTRRTSVRTRVSGGGGVLVSSASRSSGGFGGSGCWVVRSGPTRGNAPVGAGGGTGVAAALASLGAVPLAAGGAAGDFASLGAVRLFLVSVRPAVAEGVGRGLPASGSSSDLSGTKVLVRSASDAGSSAASTASAAGSAEPGLPAVAGLAVPESLGLRRVVVLVSFGGALSALSPPPSPSPRFSVVVGRSTAGRGALKTAVA